MIVCLCRGVPEAMLRALIEAGARSPRSVAQACGAGIDCGACCVMVQELIERAQETTAPSAHELACVLPAPRLQ